MVLECFSKDGKTDDFIHAFKTVKFDLRELEEATEYDGGYSQDSAVVATSEIVHELPLESQRNCCSSRRAATGCRSAGSASSSSSLPRTGPTLTGYQQPTPVSTYCFYQSMKARTNSTTDY
ncbi:uncharacterized protein LOC120353773 [Nilaparvata lugens]|uniref:uncharacterized protein LOC120353773 n=1 Tax=Nilaparvata lugens TaxID=108931 RepID=UPI00193E5780|nr:uncharacterized protein LOC120353773 [Nilaparvata lugens]